MRIPLIMALAAAGLQPVWACDLCSVYAATEAQGGSGKGLFAGVAEQFTHFGTLQLEGQEVMRDGGQYLNSSVSQLFVGYNLNDRFGLQFNLPVLYREYGYGAEHRNEVGLGDGSLIGNLRLYQKAGANRTFTWTALAGVKFPFGDSAHLNPSEDDFAPGIGGHDLTLGSGSVDGVLGTAFFARWKRVFFTGCMQYAVRSEGDFGYQFANDWIWIGGPGVYLALGETHSLALQAVISGESKGQDTLRGIATDDTAVTAVYLGPQLNFTWSDSLSAQVGVDLPVLMDTTGLQVVPDYRIRAAFTWRF